ncbi:hypothetical protein B4098_1560 [Heyndrickxia coagulans]|uniref:Uncharacterized protein n=1 Tax=Heyndrickxia coagulans TaxID=1398 RepID=A0A150JZD4_HEYCO|nr:hypothetical protein B4098_1560 [Heyndrickxia coagulans]
MSRLPAWFLLCEMAGFLKKEKTQAIRCAKMGLLIRLFSSGGYPL